MWHIIYNIHIVYSIFNSIALVWVPVIRLTNVNHMSWFWTLDYHRTCRSLDQEGLIDALVNSVTQRLPGGLPYNLPLAWLRSPIIFITPNKHSMLWRSETPENCVRWLQPFVLRCSLGTCDYYTHAVFKVGVFITAVHRVPCRLNLESLFLVVNSN